MPKSRAVFLDRDGVLNDLVYNKEEEQISSPVRASQLRVFPFAGPSVKRMKEELGYKVIVISNQPGVAKRQFTLVELERMNRKVRSALAKTGTSFDAEYYCLHHPNALISKYRMECECRKPKPGMILQAAREHDIDLGKSFFVGDALIDVKCGRSAGCKTILVGHTATFLTQMMEKEKATPDYIVASLKEVPDLIAGLLSLPGIQTSRIPAERRDSRSRRTSP